MHHTLFPFSIILRLPRHGFTSVFFISFLLRHSGHNALCFAAGAKTVGAFRHFVLCEIHGFCTVGRYPTLYVSAADEGIASRNTKLPVGTDSATTSLLITLCWFLFWTRCLPFQLAIKSFFLPLAY